MLYLMTQVISDVNDDNHRLAAASLIHANKCRFLQCNKAPCSLNIHRVVTRIAYSLRWHIGSLRVVIVTPSCHTAPHFHPAIVYPRFVQVLYNELDQWREAEARRIKQAECGERRKLALRELLHKETRLLQTIDRLKITAAHEGKVRFCRSVRGE